MENEAELVLFPMERVKNFRHPHNILEIADRLHDEGRAEEAHELLDASEKLITLVEQYTPDNIA